MGFVSSTLFVCHGNMNILMLHVIDHGAIIGWRLAATRVPKPKIWRTNRNLIDKTCYRRLRPYSNCDWLWWWRRRAALNAAVITGCLSVRLCDGLSIETQSITYRRHNAPRDSLLHSTFITVNALINVLLNSLPTAMRVFSTTCDDDCLCLCNYPRRRQSPGR